MTVPRKVHLGMLILAGAWLAGVVLAPLLQHSIVSTFLYSAFSHVCHQFPERSLSLVGEPLGVCVRCTGIYAGFWISLAIYPVLHRLHRWSVPAPWILGVFLLPMAVDVLLHLTGVVHNSLSSRFLTGLAGGTILPYYLLPPVIEAVRQFLSLRGDVSHARET